MRINLNPGAVKPNGKQVIEDQAKKITNATNTQRVYLITMMQVLPFYLSGMAGAVYLKSAVVFVINLVFWVAAYGFLIWLYVRAEQKRPLLPPKSTGGVKR